MDLFRIPADSGFDPAEPFRIQLLVSRAVGPVDKVFTTFDLAYQLPARYLRAIPAAPAVAQSVAADPVAVGTQDEGAAQADLWRRIWAA